MRTNFRKGKAMRFHPKAKAAQTKVYILCSPPHLQGRNVLQDQTKGANSAIMTMSHIYGNSLQYLLLAQ